ncbi:dephospho-CoA kinase [Flavobacterium sp.]|uniref:dephospho-CoA kinase n=1 Tax=Flavobacterium sp. TaxID=239 RepID=UPI00286BDB47|nr:dephospho-CoA kinase [Flavobacterium sp.]
MTKIIGLTGGIGSGKTTIANYFQSKGIPIYIADEAAKKIMQSEEIIAQIKKSFGEAIFDNEILNRERLSKIVFNDSNKLKQLNTIIHPAVKNHFKIWISKLKNAPFIIYEAAILFESGSYKDCDKIITITAPIEDRIQRVIQRDKTTRELVLQRMSMQWNDNRRIPLSDYIIENSSVEKAKLEIDKILKKL